jgi:hypothetical protein
MNGIIVKNLRIIVIRTPAPQAEIQERRIQIAEKC